MRILFIFRIFFPSWKFFEEYDGNPKLFYKIDDGPWIPVLLKIKRHWWMCFLNAEGNMTLFKKSLIQQYSGEIENEESLTMKMTSYEMIKDMIRDNLVKNNYLGGHWCQIKITTVAFEGGEHKEMDYFLSSPYKINYL
jgi:hypothetical protein